MKAYRRYAFPPLARVRAAHEQRDGLSLPDEAGLLATTDEALVRRERMLAFLQQPRHEICPADETWRRLAEVLR